MSRNWDTEQGWKERALSFRTSAGLSQNTATWGPGSRPGSWGEAKEATNSSVQEAYLAALLRGTETNTPVLGKQQHASFSQTRGHSPPQVLPTCRETLYYYVYNSVLLIESLSMKSLSSMKVMLHPEMEASVTYGYKR